MTNTDEPTGEIYDLGYRTYDGPRLGRRYALRSLFVLSLRNTFGLGRTPLPKFLAFGLTFLAFIPAIVQLIIGAVVGAADFEFLEPHTYYGTIQVVIVLFIAAMASDLVGNDRRNDTLVLYFSRPIKRDDYALAKVCTLAVALLALTLLPQLLAFVGNWLGARDGGDWLSDNLSDLPPIFMSAVMVSSMLGSIGVLIATYAARRAFAIISVLGVFMFSWIASTILVTLLDTMPARIVMLLSPVHVSRGATLALFDKVPMLHRFSQEEGSTDDHIAYAELGGWVWIVALLVWTAAATYLAMRRYRKAV
ncbi:MAG: ABC transporter permease subunit [Actinomycetota bacterium]|jgi:ABC-2 type transport system permease protein|nr:ABC transporter permease subunit [Actinomycetota bacterium]